MPHVFVWDTLVAIKLNPCWFESSIENVVWESDHLIDYPCNTHYLKAYEVNNAIRSMSREKGDHFVYRSKDNHRSKDNNDF